MNILELQANSKITYGRSESRPPISLGSFELVEDESGRILRLKATKNGVNLKFSLRK